MTYKEIGALLRRIRERRGLSQEALGKRLNMSGANISLIENGRTSPDLVTLQAVAKAMSAQVLVAVLTDEEVDDLLVAKFRRLLPRLSEPTKRALHAAITALDEELRAQEPDAPLSDT